MTTDGSTQDERPPGDDANQDGAHQGPGRWARRGAAGIGLPPGESATGDDDPGSPPTADGADPDISPSLAGGHTGASHRDQD